MADRTAASAILNCINSFSRAGAPRAPPFTFAGEVMTSVSAIPTALLIVLAVVSVVCSLPVQTNQKVQAWGTPANGLEMSLSLDPAIAPPSTVPAITLHLRNVGAESLRILLGAACRPRRLGPNSVKLYLTDPSGSSERLVDVGPLPLQGVCGGGGGYLIVHLSPDEERSVPLEINNYKFLSSVTHRYEQAWEPGGTYTLQAELETKPEVTIQNVWKGLVKSNKLEIHFPSGN
jgi:hypothetical protein